MNLEQNIIKDLHSCADVKRAEHNLRFFKTGKGEYGEGDMFLGLNLPQMRELVKRYKKVVDIKDIKNLLNDEYHEVRLCGLMLMVELFRAAKTEERRKEVYDFYMSHLSGINNWDLVDLTAYNIPGAFLYGKNHKPLFDLAKTKALWKERIAIISTMYFVKRGDFETTIKLAESFLAHKHDLMHKAVGWMLREVGKKDIKTLYDFLDKHAGAMPRTMLRYSLEKLTEDKRKYYMAVPRTTGKLK
jgi:3-methyladenine DNA glycosylase AlkD